jgi:NADH-quinone oxidoreductase subunit L
MRNRLWFDEIFNALIAISHEALSKLAGWVDRKILKGFIIGLIEHGVDITGKGLRLFQSGSIQTYAFLFVAGVALVIYYVLGGTH